MAEAFPASSPSSSPEMTQIGPAFSRRAASSSFPTARASTEARLYPLILSEDAPNDSPTPQYRKGKKASRPPIRRQAQSAPSSTNPTRTQRERHSSPAIIRHRNHMNIISSYRPSGSSPIFTFDRSPSPNPMPPPIMSDLSQGSPTVNDRLRTTPGTIEDRIRKRVREPLTAKQVSGEAKGYVYIFEAEEKPGVFKIGFTDRTVTERKKEIEQSCGRRLIEHYRSELLPFAQRAEKLCHDMLSYYRCQYACSRCTKSSTIHEEWFEVPLKVAERCVDLWTKFLRQQPYNDEGKLCPFWRLRLESVQRCSQKEAHQDHNLRHQRWHNFASASYLAHARHHISRIRQECRSIEFYRSWFIFLLLLSFPFYLLIGWLGNAAPLIQFLISFGYFLPAQLIQGPNRKASRMASHI